MDAIPEPSWVVRDLIPDEGYCILFGPRSSFKTFVALDVALSVATGFPEDPTWEVATSGPVLFAIGEGRAGLARRVAGWEVLHHGGRPVRDLVLVDPVPTTVVSEENLAKLIKEALRRHPGGYRLVVIDTLGRAMQGADENSQRDASAMTALAARLRGDLGGSVLALHHSGAAAEKRPRGSTVFEGDADTLLRASRRGRDLAVDLHMAKQKDAPEWEAPRRVRMARVLTPRGDATLAAAPAPQQSVEELKEKAGRDAAREEAVLGVIDREIGEVLAANPLKAWTQTDLAEALAMLPSIRVEGKTLASVHLIRVRERDGTLANRAYDPARNRNAGRWRWPG